MPYTPPPTAGGSGGEGRCGMCGSCGSMPPWAPEVLRNASPAARRALSERMKEKQRRFIAERDARLRDMNLQGSGARVIGEVTEEAQAEQRDQGDAIIVDDTQSEDIPPADEIPLETAHPAATTAENDSTLSSSVPETPNTVPAPPALALYPQSSPSSSLTPPLDSASSPRRKPARRSVMNGTHPVRIAHSENNPSMSSTSLRSDNSDADSFHTAEEVDQEDEAKPSDVAEHDDLKQLEHDSEVPLEEVPVGDESDTAGQFADWQAFEAANQSETQAIQADATSTASRRDDVTADEDGEAIMGTSLQETPANDMWQSSAQSSSGAIPTLSMLQLSPGQSLTSIPSDNLEETVSARRPPARGQAVQSSSSHSQGFAPPSEIVPLQHADATPSLECEDCEKWRARVEELQGKVEALTSALAARKMECASLRARSSGKVREPNRNEARLIQECESLRVTTEFLYQKLERYERKAHIGIGDVH